MYKEAVKRKLRFNSSKGLLTLEQVFTLSLADLKKCIETAYEVIKATSSDDEELGFLDKTSTVNKDDQLVFNVLKDIYLDKVKELEDSATAKQTKADNEGIMALIAQKQKEDLSKLSVEDLKKLLK